jgi:hypothetical protein
MPQLYEDDCYLKHLLGAQNPQGPGGTTTEGITTTDRVVYSLWTNTNTHAQKNSEQY